MRKIEERMVQAIRDRENFTLSNTSVKVYDNDLEVELFGNLIARLTDDGILTLFTWCKEEYRSMTTKSRMNAILQGLRLNCAIIQRNGSWYLREDNGSRPTPCPNGKLIMIVR